MLDQPPPAPGLPTKPTRRRGIFAEHIVRRIWAVVPAVAVLQIIFILLGHADEPLIQIARASRATVFCIGAFVIAYVVDLLSRPE